MTEEEQNHLIPDREIEFRLWDKNEKKMIYPSLTLSRGRVFEISDSFNNSGFPDGCIWMQYIGEKDKNGTKIFEGDIINGRYGITKVWFVDAGFQPFCGDINVPRAEDSEVIGNIFEKEGT